MSALDKLRDKLAMYESTPPDGVNTPGKPDAGHNNTPVNPASQTTAPLRKRLFTVTAKGKEQARRKLKEIQDAKLREVQTASTSFSGHTDSKFIAEESPTMSSCATGETEVGVGMKEIEKLKSVQFNPNEGPEKSKLEVSRSTTDGKLISVSEKSCETKTDDPDEKHCVMIEGSLDMSPPTFRTARGKSIVVSDKAVAAAKAKFNEDSEHPMCMSPEPASMMSGFTTASRKKITISDEAIKAAKAKLCDEELPETHERAYMMSGFTTASRKKISVSEEALKAAKAKLCDEDFDKAPERTNVMCGFSTAGGNLITVSDEAIEVARAKLCDEDLPMTRGSPNMVSGFITASKKKITVSDEAIKAAKAKLCDEELPETHERANMMSGFTTASKKKITVSEEAIKAAKAKFRDEDLEKAPELADMMSGFTTASKKKIIVSDEALEAARAKFCDEEFEEAPERANIISGFTTASRKKITVSEEAIKAAKAKFCNEDSDIPPELATMSGFSTAGGNLIKVSDEAIKTAREKLFDEKLLETPEREHLTSGFSTAGGKRIKISEEAVNAARNRIHQDASIDVMNVGVVSCLPEACGTVVSEDALIGDKNTMVFENQNEIVVVMAGQDCSLSKVETTDLKLEDPSPCDETINSDSEVAECTRILLEDIENSDAESDWTSPSDVEHNKKPKNSLACVPSFSGDVFPLLNVVVVRVYPIMYCTLGKDNKNCFMAEKAFAKRQMDKAAKEAELRESLISGVEAEVRKRFIKNEKINPKDLTPRALRRMSADELLHILNNCEEDAETISFVMGNLNITAKQDLERARTELSENIQRAVAEELAEKIKNTTEKVPSRVLKLRVMDQDSCNNSEVTTSGVITIWNAQDEIINNIREGKIYGFQFLKPAPFHAGQEIRLGSTKTTRISSMDGDIDMDVFKRKLSLIPDVIAKGFNPPFGEFDTVGVVMKVEQFKESIGQIVHLIEENGFVLKVKFWNALYDWDLQDVLKPGKIVVCLNLQWRLTSAENTMAFAQEASDFTTNPKEEYLLNGVQHLSGGIETIKQLIGGEGQSSGESSTTASALLEESVEVSGVSTRYSTKRRYSERYGDPPELAAMPVASPSKRGRVSKKFVTPRRITPKN